jgi:hypothetical protein
MSLGKRSRRKSDDGPPPRSVSPPGPQTTWAEETFVSVDEAKIALSEDRPAFVSHADIMELIPIHISWHIIHSDSVAQIRGFQELFILLNNDPNTSTLRRLIEAHFNDSPPLRGHLSQYSYCIPIDMSTELVGGHSNA